MNIASMDIGSNTVLLLIAEVNEKKEFEVLTNRYEMPRLSKGLKPDGNINDAAVERFYKVLDDYIKVIRDYDCKTIIAKATNAFRIAANAQEIAEDVKARYDFDIEIISGDKEAELSYLGAASSLPSVNEKFVMDIGGGSTEIIYGKDAEIVFKKSHPVGAVMLTEKFVSNEPPTASAINDISDYLNQIFADLPNRIPASINGIAVAGTPTSIASMIQGMKEYEEDSIEGYFLSKDDTAELIMKLSQLRPDEILERYGTVVKGREDVITSGAIILNTVAEILKVDGFTVSGRGIRYGALVDYLANN